MQTRSKPAFSWGEGIPWGKVGQGLVVLFRALPAPTRIRMRKMKGWAHLCHPIQPLNPVWLPDSATITSLGENDPLAISTTFETQPRPPPRGRASASPSASACNQFACASGFLALIVAVHWTPHRSYCSPPDEPGTAGSAWGARVMSETGKRALQWATICLVTCCRETGWSGKRRQRRIRQMSWASRVPRIRT